MDKPLDLSGVPNRQQLLREAKRLGCTVAVVGRTGEIRVTHQARAIPVTLNNRRKSGTRALIVYLRYLQDREQRGDLGRS